MSRSPSRPLANTIFVPSGDHAGWRSRPSFVSSTMTVPSALAIGVPYGVAQASDLLSGDHAGWRLLPGVEMSVAMSLPSGCAVRIFAAAFVTRENAMSPVTLGGRDGLGAIEAVGDAATAAGADAVGESPAAGPRVR